MIFESLILRNARRFTPEKDERADDTSSIAPSPWLDSLTYPETQPPASFTPPPPNSGFMSLSELRDLEQQNAKLPSTDKSSTTQPSLPLALDYQFPAFVGPKDRTFRPKGFSDILQHIQRSHSIKSMGSNLNKTKERLLRFSALRRAQTYSSSSTDYTVKGYVGADRYQIDALPDTGAKRNFIAQQLVDKLGLVPKAHTEAEFRLPTGATVESCGRVDVPFRFVGESEDHLLDCCILPKCTQDLILCQAFLKATSTLTKFAHRITKSFRTSAPRFRFNLVEDDTCCMQGSFDGIPSVALADTGCDAMLISADFARRHSLEIDKGLEHRHVVEYADGSLDTTTGIVSDSTWQFRSSWDKIPCNFYVLDDLKADIVLSSHFIFQHEIFSKFEEDIVDMGLFPARSFGDLYNIRLISHYSSALQSLEASSIADMNSPGSFGPAAIKAERVRRDQIRDAINALPREQQDQARIDERNRQEIWEGYRKRHLERQGGDTDSTQQVLVVQKQRWWQKGPVWRRFGKRAT
ncbi:uncharacterized protein FSUBG_12052 [Fusarium subglutinans]|uniref:Uncharacterized protein n=1 Tax=Gibberella subglutinans TaxID=42677 RepID=A0A8H5L5B1_GIBSU|nr:uncharacterized protein FSUBG_12052 [Fusarium subglutinans]KAF5586665.1 hypothetical protein FSUBG_12052 [Fusarium subglutinans]